jgi:hypothetical protein
MNRKIHAQNVLLQLTEEQQETLYDWLLVDSYRAVQARVAAAPPEGFGLKVHLMSLQRFFKRQRLEARADWGEELSVSTPDRGEQGLKIMKAAEQSITASAYELATTGQSLKEMDQAARCLGSIRRLELKQGYLRVAEEHLNLAREQAKLEREKFEINTARLALEHAADLKEIMNDPMLDDEDKIRKARSKVFLGKIPE